MNKNATCYTLHTTRVLGIDPGYERLGIAIIEKLSGGKESYVYSECFKTSSKEEHHLRLSKIQKIVESYIKKYNPNALAIESLFLNTNQKTAIKVAEARGVVLATCSSFGMDVYEYTPLQIKTAVTGYGRSEKSQVMSMVGKLIKLPEGKKWQDDEYDAIAVALTCFACIRF